MATTNLTKANFKQTVHNKGIVVIDWWAPWCGPCRAFAPVYESVSEKHPELVFGKIDTEAERELASAFEIRSIPTLMIVRDGVLLFNQPGMLPESALEDLIGQVAKLDMEEVVNSGATAEAAQA